MKIKLNLLTRGSSRLFPSYLMNSIYVSAMLIALLPVIVTGGMIDDFFQRIGDFLSSDTKQSKYNNFRQGEKAVGPGELVNTFASSVKHLEHFVQLEMELENFGEESNLYNVPENERNCVLQELYEDPEVQKTIKECEKFHVQPVCDNFLYRKINGTCSNLNHPEWGSAITEQDRFLPASYVGISGFRKSIGGADLPLPRNVSLKLKDKDNPSQYVSALFTFFGQIVTHDITSSPEITINGSFPNCCDPSEKNNPACAPLYYPDDDPFFSQFNLTCLPFVRTVPYPKCNFEKRSPMNKQTSFLDVSNTYGNNDELAQSLRTNDGSGRLRAQDSMVGELMPKNHDKDKEFCPRKGTEKCFEGGDDRIYQHTMIMILQTLYLRLHNIFADSLHGMNPYWDGDKVYQESRRIVGAIHQYIVYKEYLPYLIGPGNMEKYDLKVNFNERSLYDDTVRPNILTEFSTAIFRLHSMVPTKISKNCPQFRFDMSYSNSDPIYNGQLESLLSGSSEMPSQQNDRFVTAGVSNYLSRPPGAAYGTDLCAFDVQRGRDHGLPPYVEVVKKCSDGTIVIQNFCDLRQTMREENVELLRSLYIDVMDVDLWTGITLETSMENSVTGPTAACISSVQFHRLKFGDPFFFTHTNGRYPFTKNQLKSIKTYSLARILCDTTRIRVVRRFPLLPPSKKNGLISCQSLCEINLRHWKEKPEL